MFYFVNKYDNVIIPILMVTNLVFHLLGFHLLMCLYKIRRHTPQQLFLINLAFIEALRNFLSILMVDVTMFISTDRKKEYSNETLNDTTIFVTLKVDLQNDIGTVQRYISILIAVIYLLQYTAMLCITIDRFLASLLTIRYRIHCSVKKAQYLLIGIWMLALVIFLAMSVFCSIYPYNSYMVYVFAYLPLDFILISVTIFTYSFLFYKHVKSQKMQERDCTTNSNNTSLISVFRKSKFYISILLITSFIIFFVIPDIIFTFAAIIPNNITKGLIMANAIPVLLSDLFDAWIYIFMQQAVRKLFCQKICERFCCCCCYCQHNAITGTNRGILSCTNLMVVMETNH